MRLAFRVGAIVIALAALIDPALARRVTPPVSIAIQLPRASDPGYQQALEMRTRIEANLDGEIIVDGAGDPSAIVAIGNAEPLRGVAPVFVVAPPEKPGVRIEEIGVPRALVTGQAAPVRLALRASKLPGRTSSVVLELGGMPLQSIEHEWTSDDERLERTFTVVLPGPGVHRVRARVATDGVEASMADAAVVVRARPLRVFVYEPRPSWAVTFVRRSLEADAIFSVASTSRSSKPVATRSSAAPEALAALDVDAFDALLLGGLDELGDADWRAAHRFVSERGGTLLLLPDRQLSDAVRRRFDLPDTEEVLLDTPASAEEDAGLKGSELLVMRTATGGFRTLASLRQGSQSRPIVIAAPMGAGTLVLSGALDAWRYRGDGEGQFDRFWRGVVADGALAAAPKIDVQLSPAIARPGDLIAVRATVRETEFTSNAAGPVQAALVLDDGSREPIRLWPGPRPGGFEATIPAPPSGHHIVEVELSGRTIAAPLVVADDVVHPVKDTSAAWKQAAAATGGAVVETPEQLISALSGIDAGSVEQVTRPMRSPWWIVPFALLLSAEWALRRRSGLK